jgi:hypothetical protein
MSAPAGTRRAVEAPFDLLQLPGVGRLLRRPGARALFQWPMLALAALLVWHGMTGSQWAPRNLATLWTWVHWRGLLVVALLVAGNVFCMACPLLLPSRLARRAWAPRWRWPARLRSKWIGVALFLAVLFAYELFDLWSSPLWTAWLVAGYFAAALAVDVLFQGATFCKWICPIGQFNFVASTASPFEIQVRDADTCTRCRSRDCLVPGVSGCELDLFVPNKLGNLDCTFCLDCVRACPHDNVGWRLRLPAAELWEGDARPGVGRLSSRLDLAALAGLFVFGAYANVFAMVGPFFAFGEGLARVLGVSQEAPVLALYFAIAVVAAPLALLASAAEISRRAGALAVSRRRLTARFVWGLVPLGFGLWLAHYGFHLLTGLWTFVPVLQGAVHEATGAPLLGVPLWGLGGLSAAQVDPIELGLLLLGAIVSCAVLWRLAQASSPRRPGLAFAPWAVLNGLLFLLAVWLLRQPMEMRGTFLGK